MKLTMTRVLTPLAALAIAFGVQAAAVSTDGFETATSTAAGSRTGWSFTAGNDNAADASAVTAYGEAAKPSNLPDDFAAAGDYFLKLSTEDGTLFRNVNGEAVAASVPVGAGLYVDTDVQFTLTDSTDRPTPVAADKFIIWLEADETAHTTNLCVYGGSYTYTAGTIARGAAAVYNLSAQGVDIAPGSWHRLTVKAVANAATMAGDVALPGFQVYIDGTLMESAEYFFDGADTFINDSAFVTAAGAAWDLLAAKTFFPALTPALAGLEQIGFSGEGKIDNVAVTGVTPGFLPANRITLSWGSDVSTVAYTVNGQTTPLTTSGSVITVEPDTTITIMKANMTFANGRDASKFAFGDYTAGGIANVTPIIEDGVTVGLTISSNTSGAGGNGSLTLGTFIDNSKVALTLDWSGLLDVGQAGQLSGITYSVNGGAATAVADISLLSETITGLDPSSTVAVTVTYAANSGWVNSGWTATSDNGGTVSLSGTTVTVAADPVDSTATLVIAAIKPVATVNGVAYADFADALDAAALAGTATIQLSDNVTLDAAATIAADKNITIDLAGKTITVDSAGVVAAVFSVEADGTLNITNSTETVGAVVAGDASACIANAGTLNLFAGNFGGLISGGVINVTGGAYTDEISGANLPTGYSFQTIIGAVTYIYGLAPTAYTITYMNGANELTGLTPATYTIEDNVTLPTEVNLGVVGVAFSSWKDGSDNTVASWSAGDKTGDLVFYAQTTAVVVVPPPTPWFDNPQAVVLAEGLPTQDNTKGPSAFHGQGQGEYLGLTFGTNPKQFSLYTVDGTNALTTLRSITASQAPTAGFRGVAISKTLGVAMTLAYWTASYTNISTMYAYPLAGGEPTAVVLPNTYSFDSAAFSPDGQYLFSNVLDGEADKTYFVKWSVAKDSGTGVITLTKVGSKAASGRGRNLAYARINGRDLVFAMADGSSVGNVDVLDMTGNDTSAWTANTLIANLPAHSYGSLCVSGVNTYGVDPTLTIATSINNDNSGDVLNVYTLTVPASGTVTATLEKSFDQAAMAAAGFGTLGTTAYGNTVYVTDDNKTIYFGRADKKLYAAEYVEPDVTATEPGATAGTYDDATAATNAAETAAVAVPAAVAAELTAEQQVAYTNMFAGKVVAIDGGANPYAVVIELEPAVAEDLQEDANEAATNVLANIDVRSVTVEAKPGLYYSIKAGTTLGNMTEGDRTMATSGTVNLAIPGLGTTGFYQVLINITDK